MIQRPRRTMLGVGIVLGSLVFRAAVVHPDDTPSPFPPLDTARVECTAFRPASSRLCYATAREVYQLNELILKQLEDGDFAQAVQETLPTTPQVFPDGTVVYGIEGALTIVPAWVGSQDFTFGSISHTFRFRPLDPNTVVAYGIIEFTIEDHEHGDTRRLVSVQTELFRRNHRLPRGWEQVYEQLGYQTPLRGDTEQESATIQKRVRR